LGGLLPLLLLIRRFGIPASNVVPRFSRLALLSVAAIALTGVYSAAIEVRTLEGLTGTSYGLALLVKSGVFLLLMGLGAVNLLYFSPRLENPAETAAGGIGKTVRIELALGLLVLLAAGLLTGIPPSQEALQARRQQGYVGSYASNGVEMALWLAPARAGNNEIAVDLSGPEMSGPDSPGLERSGPPRDLVVLARFQLAPDQIESHMDMGVTQAEAASLDSRRYTVRGSQLSMEGLWEIQIIVRRPGVDDVTHTFVVPVRDR
jgi:hypothetical protein